MAGNERTLLLLRGIMNSVNILSHMHLAGQGLFATSARGAGAPSAAEKGYAMAALLIGMSIMAILMTVAMPVWKTAVQREKEAELIFRGQQYARAIELYQRKLPGAAPPNLDVLLDQKFLRKKYKDPITNDDFDLLSPNSPGAGLGGAPQQTGGRGAAPGRGATPAPTGPAGRVGAPGIIGAQAGISGVVSKSKASSLRLYNGRSHYNEWQFVHVPRAAAPGTGGGPGAGAPGQRGGPGAGRPGQRGGPGPFQPGISPTGRGTGRGDGRGGPPTFPPNQPGGRGPGPGGQPLFPR
jgi:type II secretory pathway pseudopilin PulG